MCNKAKEHDVGETGRQTHLQAATQIKDIYIRSAAEVTIVMILRTAYVLTRQSLNLTRRFKDVAKC